MSKEVATKKLDGMDLEPILIKAMDPEEGYGWTKEYAIRVAEEYRRFLDLCVRYPEEAIVPSSIVDDFWHLHILDTQKYRQDCEEYLGFFLDHFPYFGMRSKADEENLAEAWEQTKRLYNKQFSEKPGELWPNSNRCPNCGRRCRDDKDASGLYSNVRPSFKTMEAKAV